MKQNMKQKNSYYFFSFAFLFLSFLCTCLRARVRNGVKYNILKTLFFLFMFLLLNTKKRVVNLNKLNAYNMIMRRQH